MEVELIELKEKERNGGKENGRGGGGLTLSCFIKDINCNGVFKWKGRIEMKIGKGKGKILNSIVV